MLRRPLALAAAALLAVLLLLGTPGCGGSDTPKASGDATAEALSYFPSNAGLVALIDTDAKGQQIQAADDLLDRFPGSSVLIEKLKQEIEKTGVDFDRDLVPLLGNDIALGTAGPGGLGSLLIAFVANDAEKLHALAEGQVKQGQARKIGEHAGATLYQDGADTFVGVRDSTVVIADTRPALTQALDRHDDENGLTTATFEKAFADIPHDGLVRIYGNAPALLASPTAAAARRVPWVAALGAFAVNLRAEEHAVSLDARADTSSGSLRPEDLPIAAGSDAPPVAGDGPIRVALRDPSQLVDFAQSAAQAVSPVSFAAFAAAKAVINARYGVDLDRDVVDQLTGDAQVSTDLHSFQVRVGLRDPAAMERTLRKLAPILPDFLEGAGISGAKVESLPGGAYGLTRDGRLVAAYKVVGRRLVIATGSLADLEEFAKAPDKTIDGARGALTFSVSGDLIADLLGDALGLGDLGGVALRAIDDVTGWAEISTTELRIHASLAIG